LNREEALELSSLNFKYIYLYYTGLCVLRRTCRQDYETLFHVVILSKHHHHREEALELSSLNFFTQAQARAEIELTKDPNE
jgi:hypothetical protein